MTRDNYVVHYWFIDSTYWDDGNRSTHREKEFTRQDIAVDFARGIVKNGTTETSKVSGKTSKFTVSRDSIRVDKVITHTIPWWAILDDEDYLVKQLASKMKYGDFDGLSELKSEIIEHFDKSKFDRLFFKSKEGLA